MRISALFQAVVSLILEKQEITHIYSFFFLAYNPTLPEQQYTHYLLSGVS